MNQAKLSNCSRIEIVLQKALVILSEIEKELFKEKNHHRRKYPLKTKF